MFDGSKLTKLRDIYNLSLRDLEDLTGVTFSSLSDIESGVTDNPRKTTVNKILIGLKRKGINIDQEYFYNSDARLPIDVIPDMPPEVEKFIMNGDNVPYLILSNKAKKSGISPETLEKLIDLWSQK